MPGPIIKKPNPVETGVPLVDALLGHLFPADDPLGGLSPSPMVAIGGPGAIAALKYSGKKMLNRLEQLIVESRLNGESKKLLKPADETMDALKVAQARWPRIFGHIDEIRLVPGLKNSEGRALAGQMNPYHDKRGIKDLTFGPWVEKGEGMGSPGQVVGHEMWHAADYLGRPDMMDQYRFANKLPGGYWANSAEFQARGYEDRFRDILNVIRREYDRTGIWNPKVRVPMDPRHRTIPRRDLD